MRRIWRRVVDRLRALAVAAAATGAAHGPQPASAAPSQAETEAWQEAQGANTPESFQRYLELYPTGAYVEAAFLRLIERTLALEPQPDAPAAAAGTPSGPSAAAVLAAARLSLY